jgi:hypothetical protein
MSTRSVSGANPFGFVSSAEPPEAAPPDDSAAAHAPPPRDEVDFSASALADGIDPPALAPAAPARPGGLAVGAEPLARIATRELALENDPAFIARVAAGFATLDDCLERPSAG